ncbi:hypothetical protein R5H30_09225 [Sulfitobacter sp. D35]|uniref:hypothetical protein n=1 Tax=Sulfitobacter sp. D35 TaxID=3083252 RepID=UPI00296FFAE5|nr:hypothetical protein [Sulfitobacter sp. D35]MDW4498159.1 hypothetical protein [Sulfitobacter sp. D35]
MKGLSLAFMLSGIVAVIVGMVWGLQMGASQDHTMAPAHAHLNLLGWVSLSIFAVYYHLVPRAEDSRLAKLHFALAVGGLILMVPGIAMANVGRGEGLAIAGSLVVFLSMLAFLVVVLRTRETADALTPAGTSRAA